MFQTLLQIITPDNEIIYEKMKYEMSVALEIILVVLRDSKGELLVHFYEQIQKSIKQLKNIRG